MKAEDLKTKTEDELKKLLLEARKNQMNLRFQRVGGQLENTAEIRKTRRTIARIKTFLNAQSRGEDVKAKAKAAPKKAAPVKKKTETRKSGSKAA